VRADRGQEHHRVTPYLDQPFVPLAAALPQILADVEAKMAAAVPPEKSRLQNQAEIFRQWLTAAAAKPRG
jgi:hypothetical protein